MTMRHSIKIMKRLALSIPLFLHICMIGLAQNLTTPIQVIKENDSIASLTVYGYYRTDSRYDSRPTPYRLSVKSNYKSLSVSRNSLHLNYPKGQRIIITVSEESDTALLETKQVIWNKVFRDFDDQRYKNIVAVSDHALMEAHLIKNDLSLLRPIMGDNLCTFDSDSSFYEIERSEQYDTFVDKGPIFLNSSSDSDYPIRVNIPRNSKKIEYSNYYNSITILYSRKNYIQISYSKQLDIDSSSTKNWIPKVSTEEGHSIRKSIKKHPCRSDVAAFFDVPACNRMVHFTVLCPKRKLNSTISTIIKSGISNHEGEQ